MGRPSTGSRLLHNVWGETCSVNGWECVKQTHFISNCISVSRSDPKLASNIRTQNPCDALIIRAVCLSYPRRLSYQLQKNDVIVWSHSTYSPVHNVARCPQTQRLTTVQHRTLRHSKGCSWPLSCGQTSMLNWGSKCRQRHFQICQKPSITSLGTTEKSPKCIGINGGREGGSEGWIKGEGREAVSTGGTEECGEGCREGGTEKGIEGRRELDR